MKITLIKQRPSFISVSKTPKLLSLVIVLIFLANFFIFVSPVRGSDPVLIMPLGDSITRGEDLVGYRRELYVDLKNAGYNVDFVGSLQDGSSTGYTFDYDHEGHGGWSDAMIAGSVFSFLTANPADIVLLHIGTNGIDPDPNQVRDILDEVDRFSEDVIVVLARIINRQIPISEVTEFNDNVEAMA